VSLRIFEEVLAAGYLHCPLGPLKKYRYLGKQFKYIYRSVRPFNFFFPKMAMSNAFIATLGSVAFVFLSRILRIP
jgi:hypothetical protein